MCQSEFIHPACYIPESVCVVCVCVREGPQMCVSVDHAQAAVLKAMIICTCVTCINTYSMECINP